jgi:outer membrane protein OmpA-like peptidoglycan-associated protein
MKKILFLFALWAGFSVQSSLIAQTSESRCALSYKIIGVDHVRKFAFSDFMPGAEIAYSRFLNPSFNLQVPFRLASVNVPAKDDKSFPSNGRIMGSLDARLVYKLANGYLFQEEAAISPYLLAGAGLNLYGRMKEKGLDVQIPVGAGINFRVAQGLNIQVQSEYRVSALAKRNNWVHGLGLQFLLSNCCGGGKCCAAPAPMPVVENVPDQDADGVADAVDNCPLTPGTVANNGCPEISEAVKATLSKAMYIQFEFGSDKIKAESLPVLDEVVTVMKDNPTYHLDLRGHTDSKGSDETNMDLSKRRAMAAFNYLVSKGIDATRLASSGFGETSPIDTNDTDEGRAKNRRVEFIVR